MRSTLACAPGRSCARGRCEASCGSRRTKTRTSTSVCSGFQGKGQIGKGMWPKPDSMKGMLEAKIVEPMAGASTAWVPSPSAGVLHSIHYHRVDVPTRQMQLAMRPPRDLQHLLTPPLVRERPEPETIK